MSPPQNSVESQQFSQDLLDTQPFDSGLFEENPATVSISTGRLLLAPQFTGKMGILVKTCNGSNQPVGRTERTQEDNETNNRQQRTQFKHAKRAVFAACDLFTEPDKMPAWNFCTGSNTKTHRVKGRITACPTKKNNYVHTVTWDTTNIAGFKREWIRTVFPGN